MTKFSPLQATQLADTSTRFVTPARADRSVGVGAYPMTAPAIIGGLIAAAAALALTGDFIAGYALLALFVAIGLTWRSDESPVFPFVLGVQWVQVTSGYFFRMITGVTPADIEPGNIDLAVELALAGLIVLALGVRVVCNSEPRVSRDDHRIGVHNQSRLFWLVIALYSVNYVSAFAVTSASGLRIIMERVLMVRQIPLLVLWYEVIRRGRDRRYLWASLVFVVVPALGSYLSDFKIPLFLALIVSASTWKPWERRSVRMTWGNMLGTAAIGCAVVFLALVWQAGVKSDTRKAYGEESIGSSPIERVRFFVESAERAVPAVFNDTQYVVEGLVQRVWYVVLLSRVLDHVPAFEPHSDGELLQIAVSNALQPRLLFPSKPPLPSDTYFTRRFAGVMVDDRAVTSISIGYMAEFYADWGFVGMFVSIFAYGALLGLITRVARRFTVGSLLTDPTLITMLLTVTFFEQQFVKLLGALVMSVLVTMAAVLVARRWFERFIDTRELSEEPDLHD